VPRLIERLEAGESVAIVTDAGTPGVSDPGLELVQAAIERGIAVDPIPGASAPLTALIASGFPMVPFTVFGFAPSRSKARSEWLEAVVQTHHTFSFFEAPHRIQQTLQEAHLLLGERQIVVARELTKMYQEFLRGTAAELAKRIAEPRGEFTLIVGPTPKQLESNDIHLTDAQLADEFWRITNNCHCSRRDVINQLAKKCGRSAREIYSAIERAKNIGHTT
jgi:16S rRNA (cytidine1402-2'-O)-methyltransferase